MSCWPRPIPLPEEDLLASTREAGAAGLLAAHGDGYAFPHALIRQVLYAAVLPGQRRRLHRRLAEALAARAGRGPGPPRPALAPGRLPGPAAAAAVAAARRAVSARAYPEADRNYALAIELAQWLPEAGPGLLEEAAQAASWAEHPDRAAGWAARGARPVRRRPRDRPGPAAGTARALPLGSGRPQRRGRGHRAGGGAAADGPPSPLRARVLAALATRRMLLGEFDAALPLAVAGCRCRRSRPARSPSRPMAWRRWASSRRSGANWTRGWRRCAHRSPSRCRAGSIEDIVRAAANQMYLLHRAGRFAEALRWQAGRQAARVPRRAAGADRGPGQQHRGGAHATGRWAEADQLWPNW